MVHHAYVMGRQSRLAIGSPTPLRNAAGHIITLCVVRTILFGRGGKNERRVPKALLKSQYGRRQDIYTYSKPRY